MHIHGYLFRSDWTGFSHHCQEKGNNLGKGDYEIYGVINSHEEKSAKKEVVLSYT